MPVVRIGEPRREEGRVRRDGMPYREMNVKVAVGSMARRRWGVWAGRATAHGVQKA